MMNSLKWQDDSLQKMEPSSVNSVTQLGNLKLKPVKEACEVNNGLSQHNISSATELLKPYICLPIPHTKRIYENGEKPPQHFGGNFYVDFNHICNKVHS
jgi:hypothetical protein